MVSQVSGGIMKELGVPISRGHAVKNQIDYQKWFVVLVVINTLSAIWRAIPVGGVIRLGSALVALAWVGATFLHLWLWRRDKLQTE